MLRRKREVLCVPVGYINVPTQAAVVGGETRTYKPCTAERMKPSAQKYPSTTTQSPPCLATAPGRTSSFCMP